MLKQMTIFFGAALMAATSWAQSAFEPMVLWNEGVVEVSFDMPLPGQHLYEDMFSCTLGEPLTKPETHMGEEGRALYEGEAVFTWKIEKGQSFTLDYQGCDADQCYMPETRTYTVGADGLVTEGAAPAPVAPAPVVAEPAPVETPAPAAAAPTTRRVSGFVEPEAFVKFLQGTTEAVEGQDLEPSFLDDPQGWVAANGLWLLILVVFVGGLALNLTPCVLPMMPINLAIIGAGAAGGSRLRGALRGGAYGLGIALAYGALSLIPVFTGAAFGVVQSAWWFNAIIAVVFVLLALALLDIFMIDFTRFAGQGSGKQGAVAAFVAGAVSAILAGACVAPVLISVLLLTSTYVADGAYWALCLPFVLGVGMAAPWPIAGAGLSFLPKPGAWMVWVKRIFAVVVLLFAAHYGWVAIKSLLPAPEGLSGDNPAAVEAAISAELAKGRPVLLDFWGTACKACDKMDRVTFPAPEVQKALEGISLLKVRMDLADRATRAGQEHFEIKGLPTYILITPAQK